jgi:N-acetyl sugar amidotransferase
MHYCSRCILPDSRPGIVLNEEGICTGCIGHDYKENKIDWDDRAKQLDALVAEAKARSMGYDCIVPVSGGKDSWYQVIKAKELGVHLLAVTWRTPARTEIGQRNLDHMIEKLQIDHIDYTINPEVKKRFMVAAFERAGDPGLPMHMAIMTLPRRLAVQLRVPLILWGENPQLEFGGNETERLATDLDDKWASEHGCMQGTVARDWATNGMTEKDLLAYTLPDHLDYKPKSIFLGAFTKWNSFENTRVSTAHGFEWDSEGARTGTWNFADIDCDFVSLHHFPKWFKFGMTRAWDNLSVQIRHGEITRDQALATVKELGPQIPHDDIRMFCEFVDRPERWFWETCEKFRNTDIWYQEGGNWKLRDFIFGDWDWRTRGGLPA